MSPILVRPVREQLEHDRLIRHLEPRYKRKLEVGVNTGDQQEHPLKVGGVVVYPDIVVTDGRKVVTIVEVETGESVNNLEAMAQWVHFSRFNAPFHLYVPVQGYDTARRLCQALGIKPAEVWTYRPEVEGFDLVRMHAEAAVRSRAAARSGGASKGASARAVRAATTAAVGRTAAKGKPAASKSVKRVTPTRAASSSASRGTAKTARAARGKAKAKATAKARRPTASKAAQKGSSGRRR